MSDDVRHPRYLSIPERRGSYGAEAADLATAIGRSLDVEQLIAVDAMLSYGPGGRWAQFESAVIMPRQNGKSGGIILPIVLFDLVCTEKPVKIIWTAHKFKTAREAYDDFVSLCDTVDFLKSRVKRISRTNDDRSITFMNGAKLEFLARSTGGGRGLGGDRVILDEALYLDATMMGALMPTLSARPDPQLVYGASAGVQGSDILRGVRDRGRAGGDPSLTYIEWCAAGSFDDPGCDKGRECSHENGVDGCVYDSWEAICAANPAAGRRITRRYLEGERRAFRATLEGRIEYGRERLGWWDDPGTGDEDLLSIKAWKSRTDMSSQPGASDTITVAWDVSPGLESASVAVAAVRDDGHVHLELAEWSKGTAWLSRFLEGVVSRHDLDTITYLPSEHNEAVALSFSEDLKSISEPMSRAEVPTACVLFESMIDPTKTPPGEDRPTEIGLFHLGDEILSSAVQALRRRKVGDGGWVPARASSSTDISAICAAIAAVHSLAKAEEPMDAEEMMRQWQM